MTRIERVREDEALLAWIEQESAGHPFGSRPPASPARDRLQRRGLIVRFLQDRKAGNPNRWRLTVAGRELATTLKAGSQ